MDKRKALGANGAQPVFCQITTGKVGGSIDPSYIRHTLKRLALRAGIEKRVHAHGLRHTLAGEMVREHHDLSTIQVQLGHKNAATTDRYLRGIAPERLVEAMQARPSWSDAPRRKA